MPDWIGVAHGIEIGFVPGAPFSNIASLEHDGCEVLRDRKGAESLYHETMDGLCQIRVRTCPEVVIDNT